MAFTLQNLLVEGYKRLGQLTISKATGGTTASIVDSSISDETDNAYKNGAVFIVRDAGGASAAPEGEMAFCTGFTASTGTFSTAASAFTAAVAAGDIYGYTNDLYPFYTMIEIANTCMMKMGQIVLVDTTTLDTESNKTEYAYSVTWKYSRPYRIDFQGHTDDADDNKWTQISNWDYIPATAGSEAVIVLPQLISGRDLRIWYKDYHPTLADYNDVIYEGWDKELVISTFVKLAIEWQNRRLMGGDDFLLQAQNDISEQWERTKIEREPKKPPKKPKLFVVGGRSYGDTFTNPDGTVQ